MKTFRSARSRPCPGVRGFLLLLVAGVITALTAGTPAYAQDKASEIDAIFRWATPATPGCAVAVSQHGQVVVNRAYGLADIERDVPITPATVFDAASVVKQFVAASVLLLVEDGRLSRSEDVRTYIPELPDYGHAITLDHLLTHTSGIRDWTGILPLAEGDPDVVTLTLRQRGLDFAPGEEWSYSNSGYELLKEIVARTSGMSFSEFTRTRLFEPLGMASTSYRTDMTEIVRNRALAYEQVGDRWKLDMHFGNERGGGFLLSTPGDLLIWNDALTDGWLGASVTQTIQEPATLNNGRILDYARGLFLDIHRGGGAIIWHTGGSAGYSSFLGRYPAQGLSIAIMCNAGESAETVMFARRIIDVLAPSAAGGSAAEASAPPIPPEGTSVAGLDPSGRAGLFFNERTGQPLRLIVTNGNLGIAGGPPLVAVTRDRFRNPRGTLSFMSQAVFELSFLSPDQFEVTAAEGDTTRYRRARPYTPTAAELDAFAGRYESDEIGTVLEMVPDNGGLVMRLYRTPDRALQIRPVDRDTFMLGMMTVRFLRDETGTVVGYDYSNPVVRNIRFTRLNDGTSGR